MSECIGYFPRGLVRGRKVVIVHETPPPFDPQPSWWPIRHLLALLVLLLIIHIAFKVDFGW